MQATRLLCSIILLNGGGREMKKYLLTERLSLQVLEQVRKTITAIRLEERKHSHIHFSRSP